ncbi:beta strand repeat-containing protein, partial [Microcoleus sp. herbarium5]|uniref:beta strand repeat-containing protein n=1 Tax=Microcoleus sp. herbarium5 TaxID=3055434 RepID=UPI003B1FF82F
ATLSANRNLTLVESQLRTSGDLNLLANNTVRVRDSVANPFVANAGGNLYIQGNQSIDILALNHLSQTPFVSGGNLTLVSDGIISTDAHFRSGSNTSIVDLSGKPANFISLYDPIFTQSDDYTSGGYTGASLKVDTTSGTGNITFNGDILITSPDATYAGATTGDEFILGSLRSVILRSGGNIQTRNIDTYNNNSFGNGIGPVVMQATGNIVSGKYTGASIKIDTTSGTGNIIFNGDIDITSADATYAGATTGDEFILGSSRSVILRSGGNIQIGNITAPVGTPPNLGPVIMQATGNIQTETIRTDGLAAEGGDISLTAGGNILTGTLTSGILAGSGKGGDINLNAGGTITTGSLASSGFTSSGDITVKAKNDISLNCIDPQSCIESFARGYPSVISTGRSGNVTIISEQGAIIFPPNGVHIRTGDIYSTSPGSITLQANHNISVDYINSNSDSTGGAQADGANINITSVNGSINIGQTSAISLANIGGTLVGNSFKTANGLSINIKAARDITTGNLNVRANQNGGQIALTSGGSINTGTIDVTGDRAAGNITIQASTGITTPTTGTAIAGTSSNGNGSNVTLSTASGDINIGDVL